MTLISIGNSHNYWKKLVVAWKWPPTQSGALPISKESLMSFLCEYFMVMGDGKFELKTQG